MGAPAPATERSGRRYYDMSIAHRHDLDIEATLDDLYANEMNVAISWNHERGFHAALGNPALAEGSFPTSGEAVRWLKEQALHHFFFRAPSSGTPKIPSAEREPILDSLCASHIAGSLSWTWDGGFYATLGEPKRAAKWAAASAGEALAWLREQATLLYPGSEFAGNHAGFGFLP